MRRGAGAALLLVAATLAVGAAWAALTWDVRDVSPGSLSYRLGVPERVRAIDLPAACEEPRYTHVGRDGERIGITTVRLASRMEPAAFVVALAPELPNGCRPSEADGPAWTIACDSSAGTAGRIEAGVEAGADAGTEAGCRAYTIELYE